MAARLPRMYVTVTIRPNGARTEIRGLPWSGRPRDSYAMLEDAIKASRRGQVDYDKEGRFFSVARAHTGPLIAYLGERFGEVKVVQHGGLARCVSACWDADPDTSWECECSCAGDNHGSGRPIGRVVVHVGAAGDLAVARAEPRIWIYAPR